MQSIEHIIKTHIIFILQIEFVSIKLKQSFDKTSYLLTYVPTHMHAKNTEAFYDKLKTEQSRQDDFYLIS